MVPDALIDAETGHFAPPYVRSSELGPSAPSAPSAMTLFDPWSSEHFWRSAISSLSRSLVNSGLGGTMSEDPRYNDPYSNDPYSNDQLRRSGVRGTDQGFWPWLTAALSVLGLLLGSYIGYHSGYNSGLERGRSAQSSPSSTTGLAPSQHRD
jgi:hypothetical protein